MTMVPRLIPQPKWFKESPELKPEDIIYFQKTESELSNDWTVGQVDSVTKSKDGVVRRACVRYFNHAEEKPRFTDRAVRSLVKLFNVEDNYFISDMAEVEAMMFDLQKDAVKEPEKVEPTKLVRNEDGTYRVKTTTTRFCHCCCNEHCKLNVHTIGGSLLGVNLAAKVQSRFCDVNFPGIYKRDLFDEDTDSAYDGPVKYSDGEGRDL